MIVSCEESVVAEQFRIGFRAFAEALIGMVASVQVLVRAVPVRAALVASFFPPSAIADAHVLRRRLLKYKIIK